MLFDSRRNERYELLDQKVDYTFGSFRCDEIFEGHLINGNEVGLCILSRHRLTVGQEITMKNYMGFSSRTAVVIWIAEDDDMSSFTESDQVLFRAGLQFSE